MQIRRVIALGIVTLAASVFALDYVEVTSVKARQRYPWNGLVDIDFTLDSTPTEPYQMQVEVFDNVGKTNLPVKTVYTEGISFKQNPCMVAIGTRRIIWDAGADLPNGFKCENVLVTCRDTRTIHDPTRYMIIDLSGGSNVTEFPVTYVSSPPRGGWTDEHKAEKLVLRRIDPGTFMAGYSIDEPNYPKNKYHRPAEYKEVSVTNSFYVGVFPLTFLQHEYFRMPGFSHPYTGDRRSGFMPVFGYGYRINLDYTYNNDTLAKWGFNSTQIAELKEIMGRNYWCIFESLRRKLKDIEVRPLDRNEWEYVMRGGCARPFYTGAGFYQTNDVLKCVNNKINQQGLILYGALNDGSSDDDYVPYKVGSYMQNALGIYDMGIVSGRSNDCVEFVLASVDVISEHLGMWGNGVTSFRFLFPGNGIGSYYPFEYCYKNERSLSGEANYLYRIVCIPKRAK